jgi:hypothetical protein
MANRSHLDGEVGNRADLFGEIARSGKSGLSLGAFRDP